MNDDVRNLILVAGVGNIFLGDDAFGLEVVQRLARRTLPGNVRVMDFGIRSYDLAYALMEPWELAILVDAVPLNDAPGTVYLIEPELPKSGDRPAAGFDAHTMNPVSVLQLVSSLGGKVCPMLIVGCQPASVDADEGGATGLSEPVQAAVDEAIRLTEEIIARNQRTTAA
ncbi:MAG TPA: hydrogenase maturation protease [Candidatus Saccharimonadales bacterium]|nr:hydrogenase maturation protease [Candidatus Saccharimonadales bacterium]